MTHICTYARRLAGVAVALIAVAAPAVLLVTPASADDPEPVTVSISDASVVEDNGPPGHSRLEFIVSLSGPTDHTITVPTFTSSGTATGRRDYRQNRPTLTFVPGGAVSKRAWVLVYSDNIDELDETMTMNIGAVSGATVADGTGVGTIIDNDTATLSISDYAVSDRFGHRAKVFISESQPIEPALTLDYATADGSATSPDDYTATSGSVTLNALHYAQRIKIFVPVTKDKLAEGDETFTVHATGVSDDRFDDQINGLHGTVTITDQ